MRKGVGTTCPAFREEIRALCDIRPEWSTSNFAFEFLLEHLTGKIDGFDEFVTLFRRSNKSGRVDSD